MALPLHLATKIGRKMSLERLPLRDPRTVARDIPGVLDVLFPRLSGGLVSSLNRKMFSFSGIKPISDTLVEHSKLQKAMLFELAIVRAEGILSGHSAPSWEDCLRIATERQAKHYDAKIPEKLDQWDVYIASHAARNLVAMLQRVGRQRPEAQLERSPVIPGLGWIASGAGDFAIGGMLVEVKHTDRNFVSGDFRQILMYWILKYSAAIDNEADIWSECLLLNPRRNAALLVKFDYLLRSASANLGRVELFELLRAVVGQDRDHR